MLNTRFLSSVSVALNKPSAQIVARGKDGIRRFGVERGFLVSSDSTVPGEGLISFLASVNQLSRGLVDPLTAAAAKRNLAPENLLLEEGLLQPGEVVSVLERLATKHFHEALCSEGACAASAGSVARGPLRMHVGAMLVDRFRTLPSEEVRTYLGVAGGALKLHLGADEVTALRLQPAEFRAARQSEVPLAAPQTDGVLRLGGALLALGLATWHP